MAGCHSLPESMICLALFTSVVAFPVTLDRAVDKPRVFGKLQRALLRRRVLVIRLPVVASFFRWWRTRISSFHRRGVAHQWSRTASAAVVGCCQQQQFSIANNNDIANNNKNTINDNNNNTDTHLPINTKVIVVKWIALFPFLDLKVMFYIFGNVR